MRYLRFVVLFCVAAYLTVVVRAQDSCQARPGETVLTIRLQPNSMEPKDEPTRIRVDDRTNVRLCLVNISPLDACSLSSRSVTPTAETNPLQSIITTISGLGAVSIGSVHETMNLTQQLNERLALSAQQSHDPNFKKFHDLADQFKAEAGLAAVSQTALREGYRTDSLALSRYLLQDFRGSQWNQFDPANAQELSQVRNDQTFKPDWLQHEANAQVYLDRMAKLSEALHKAHDGDQGSAGALLDVDTIFAQDKAVSAVLADNDTSLKTAAGALKTSFDAALKVYDDFHRRLDQHLVVRAEDAPYLIQNFSLGTDRKATITGVLSCVSSADATKATTDQINYSILYQNIPVLSASVGLLTTFQQKKIIGTSSVAASNSAGFNSIFAITDSARAQIFPMAYFNWRFLPYARTNWCRRPEDELDITTHLSAGFGVNPNSGTNQPEFFLGLGFGFNKIMLHPGVHFGRTQSLGGGFTLGNIVPSGFPGPVPVNWSYHPAFSIGFSVRVAPW